MNAANRFESRPDRLTVATTAASEWKRYCADDGEAQALDRLYQCHLRHVQDTLAGQPELEKQDTAIFITDLPKFDLSLMDVHLGHTGTRLTTLFTRKSAQQLTEMLVNIFAGNHAGNQN